MRYRAAASLFAGAALALLVAGPAFAEDPVQLGSSPISDSAGVLDDPAAAEQAIDDAFDRTSVSLFVVLVSTFESPSIADDWATATAERNGLGVDDVLLAIAVDDRNYSLSADYSTLDDAQFDAVATRIEESLRANDWDGAVVGAAEEIAAQLDPPFNPVPLAVGGGLVAAGALTAGGVAIARRRKATAGARASQKELDTRAGSLLVQLDDAVKTSEQELGFAVAQFGEAPTAEFQTALTAAKGQLKEAFEIRHRLDDSQPETAEERRTLTQRIIELCEAADAALDAQDAAFEELRALESNAPQLIESIGTQQAALPARIDAAAATVADLLGRFGAPAVDAIDENPDQARQLAAFAATSLTEATTSLAAGDSGKAAISVRAAQQSVGQVGQLLDAIDKLGADLPELAARLTAAVDDTRSDILEARGATGAAGALDAVIAEADRVLADVPTQDPSTALAAVEQVNAGLNRELSAVRDRQAQIERATAQLGRVTAEARAAVESARDYITTRRGAVGASARTRLAEAENQLTQALGLAATDAVAALAAAQQSSRLAGSALSLARSEVASFQSPGNYGGSSFDTYGGGYSGDNSGGAVLGGILDALFSGSGSSSGWSSGSSSSRRRTSSSGGFGGSSRRSSGSSSRRSSSSGGRRSRGGRF